MGPDSRRVRIARGLAPSFRHHDGVELEAAVDRVIAELDHEITLGEIHEALKDLQARGASVESIRWVLENQMEGID